MEVRVCKVCKRIFNYTFGESICPECKVNEENLFQEIKTYLRQHPGTSEAVICEKFDVSVKKIREWLSEDRLEIVEDSGIVLKCLKCGKPISSGDICDECKRKDLNNLQALSGLMKKDKVVLVDEKKPDHTNKMRFLNR